MRIAATALGSGTRCSFTVRKEAVTHRVLVPEGAEPERLWLTLRDAMLRFAGFAQVNIRCELDRLRRVTMPRGAPGQERLARLAYDYGALDDPETLAPVIAATTGESREAVAASVAAIEISVA